MNRKPTVYIETSVVSYYCSRPSRDLIVANGITISRLRDYNRSEGLAECVICTPEELMEVAP